MIDRIVRRTAAVARGLLWFCFAALSLGSGFALAHEGHDDAPTLRAPATGLAPRVAAVSPDIELLAELRQDTLLIYLDRFATNEPLNGATIEVEEGPNRATATPAGDGLYQASAPWLARPGSHALVFTVHAKDLDDLLNATLEVPDLHNAPDQIAQSGFTPRWTVYAAAVAALLFIAGVLIGRRQRQRDHGRPT